MSTESSTRRAARTNTPEEEMRDLWQRVDQEQARCRRLEMENASLKAQVLKLTASHCTVCNKPVDLTSMLSVSRKEHGLPRVCLRCVEAEAADYAAEKARAAGGHDIKYY